MVDPFVALTYFALLVAAALVVFWPRRGVWARVAELLRLTERVRMEDALKAFYHEEYEGRTGTVDGLAGVLEISRGHAAAIVRRLGEMGLARTGGAGVVLTERGRAHALRILRAHRLLERYLADRTGTEPIEWHTVAEREEHALSRDEAEELAERLGHPLYDPHGDPIPTAEGAIPPKRGVPLTALGTGDTGRILHLEDEPPEIYAEIVSLGLAPEMPIRVEEKTATTIGFVGGGQRHELSPIAAANLTVLPEPGLSVTEEAVTTLADLRPGESAQVLRLARACQGPARRRLLDLGLVPGTRVTAEMRSASGDPTAYRIRGALIGLRRGQARWVAVERVTETADSGRRRRVS